jgi:predicted permease
MIISSGHIQYPASCFQYPVSGFQHPVSKIKASLMFKNYFKIAFRNLRRNKTYAALNILGLTVGIAACLLLFVIVRFERSFDNFHSNIKNIYRLGSEFHNENDISYSGGVSFPVADAIRIDFPEIKQVASIYQWGGAIISVDEGLGEAPKKFNETGIYFAEPQFFELFNFKWLSGKPRQSLAEPNAVVLTRSIAEKYFGDWKSAIGKSIKFDNKTVYKVSGVLEDPPPNTDFPLQIVISYTSIKSSSIGGNMEDWVSTFSGACVFVALPDNLSKPAFDAALKTFAKKHRPAEYAKDLIVSQPLNEIHFDERFGNYSNRTFSKELITTLALIGIFLIIIACVNFINLATAQAVNRSKEVGVRKVLGSSRPQLAIQFICETAIITFFAIILAAAIATIVLPLLNKLLSVQMSMNVLTDTYLLLFVLSTAVLVILLSGFYPALIISGFNPITALKNKINAKMVGGLSLRRVLVVIQFSIAHVLIIATLIVVSQTNYFRNISLGFVKNSIINVSVPRDSLSHTRYEWLRNQLLQQPGIEHVSYSFGSPTERGNWNSDFKFDHSTKNSTFGANLKWADTNYFSTYDLQFVAGRSYTASDTVREFVVNETFLKRLGIADPKDGIGKEINFWDGRTVANIVGVVKDFNSSSLREPMAPVVMSTWNNVYRVLNIRIKPGKEKDVLAFTEKVWNEAFPAHVYDYTFLDKKLEGFYRQENQLASLYKIFAALAIFISCLGLYGLVSFMAAQRVKEVGIRKVLGATVLHIVYLFSKELTVLILIAFVIAAPLAWYFMNEWLLDFSYRIQLGVGVFALSMAASLIVAWLAVGYRSVRAAIVNPVRSLKSE